MYYIVSCKTYSVVAQTPDAAEAVRLARKHESGGWATFIEDTSRGPARIVGDADGITDKYTEAPLAARG